MELKNICASIVMFFYSLLAKAESWKRSDNAYTKVVGGLVALLLTIIIGILVFWKVNDAITLDSAAANTSRDATTAMASTVFNLLPLVALVIVAGIILAVVMGFGSGGEGGKQGGM